jgi:hypothetical protein
MLAAGDTNKQMKELAFSFPSSFFLFNPIPINSNPFQFGQLQNML